MIRQTSDCGGFLLNRQGMAHQGRRQGRIVGGILEILDQVMTDLDGFGIFSKVRKRGKDGNIRQQAKSEAERSQVFGHEVIRKTGELIFRCASISRRALILHNPH